ncbi:uncharacterized protein A4U43_C03F11670 [Asparagus officinalis]|uniref:Pentacotripeptide-repeat region of PRORP domain-containing protein n=1 Tax=Asparagus officinalis TaxID=4686 RepID=A0A5P1FEF2_ASPOF|nr:pentatricopeptide repeat-containing protein At3g53360, mitochondrial [Asparagus officinalis]XP_020256750.1 pentatricopeptide repeat-containing protein At3g53360, mitochondrial [Asparagus officinalis]XP_020256751.1 pentatricopeptide repeat-containing protein At3g53360, mitochondrial [Asparagus officinalis]XP_020256752.1 pentatricopeptide repeat-containing protein At3g53360, mitochondrial [Asparagus officinalis]XP_020256753.1 pentatricopeptide repeat-containing protein At3g53360, mitochondrial
MIAKFKNHQRFLFSTSASRQISPHFKTQQSTNDFISSLCKQKQFKEALDAFTSLQLQCPIRQLHPSTYTNLFIACSHLRSLHHGRMVHRHLAISDLYPDVILNNHILNMYGKCGSLADARKLFDEMLDRNLVSWTSMISGYTQNQRESEALELYLVMIRSGLNPDQFCLGSVVRSCWGLCNVELGRQLHCQVVKLDYGSERIVQNALVTMYSKLGRVGDASVVFERIGERDLTSWGSIIAGFAQQGFELKALLLFKEMVGSGIFVPNNYHFGSVFGACGGISHLEFGEQIHGLCMTFGLASDEVVGCSLSKMYARLGRLDCAKKAFCQIQRPDLVSWNSIISAFSDKGFINDVIFFFSEMRSLGLKPDEITVQGLVRTCAISSSLTQGQVAHSYAVKMGYCSDTTVCNTLLDMYSRCSNFSTTLIIFEEMNANRDLVTWNTILSACMQHRQPEQVFNLYKLMRNSNEMDHITISIILRACGELAYMQMVNQVHAHAFKVGLKDDMMVINCLIDTYAKCGSLDDARRVFEFMVSNRDVFSWSSLIVGYAQLGHGEKALELFTRMKILGIKPNHVTFVGVLTACSRVGLVDEGFHYYKVMETEYGIVPTREHCSCVIDLFARAGRLEEAERFMHQMSFEPDIIMWKTLLSACRSHNNMEIAKRAAEGILKIDPYNSAAYVLLCNTLASFGCWDGVAKLRRSMRSIGVRKSIGKSWIGVKEEVKVFMSEDRSHLETNDLYVILHVLCFEMAESGYEPKSFSWNE